MLVTVTLAVPLALGPMITVPVGSFADTAAVRSGSDVEPTFRTNVPRLAAAASLPAASLMEPAGRSTVYVPLSSGANPAGNDSEYVTVPSVLPLGVTVTFVAGCGV